MLRIRQPFCTYHKHFCLTDTQHNTTMFIQIQEDIYVYFFDSLVDACQIFAGILPICSRRRLLHHSFCIEDITYNIFPPTQLIQHE